MGNEDKKFKILFVLCLLLGGTGWICLPIQMKYVPAEYAISYRFILAGLSLKIYSLFTKDVFIPLSRSQWIQIFFQSILLYSLNYLLCYEASLYIVSGLIAVTVSLMIIPTTIFGYVFLKNPIRDTQIAGIVLGIAGVSLLFWESFFAEKGLKIYGLGLAFFSTFFSSAGTILSGKLSQQHIPVLQSTTYSMLIGGFVTFLIGLLSGTPVTFSFELPFLLSLLYLSIPLSAFVFVMYGYLVKHYGAGTATYLWILMPVVSMNVSAIFEDFSWSFKNIGGTFLVILGAFVTQRKSLFQRR